MDETYQIAFVEKPEEAAWGIIGQGVHNHNLREAGEQGFQRVCFVLQGGDGEIVGGVLGEIFWGWMHLDLLWVAENLRRQGHGGRLLARVEEEARQRGARNVFLDTFSFQAPQFYARHGYAVFGELGEFPAGHRRFFMQKAL